MTRVQWSGPGDRVFETGVDRGMFYLPDAPGVAWNGLTKISEAPLGGGSQEFYIEGEKVIEVSALEEYVATIEAFSSPREFVSCAGLLQMAPGVYAASQDPKPFGFSYRTLIGDDIQGLEMGYKIHLVYNALPKPADAVRLTVGSTPNVKPFSWSITAVPELVTRYKPSSHFVIDTRRIDPDTVLAIEDILYGNDSFDPRLLTVKELLSLKDTGLLPPPPVGAFAITLKKFRIYSIVKGVSSGPGAVKMKKLKVGGSGSPPVAGVAPYIDLLPYLISTGAANTGQTTLVLTTGSTDAAYTGWPALPGDTLIAMGGSGGAQPTGITDSRGNTWTKRAGTATTPASSIWTATANSGGYQTASGPRGVADTTTITYSSTGQAKQWILMGCRNLGAIDIMATPTSGTSVSPSISTGTPAQANELVIVGVLYQTNTTTINTPAGWKLIAKNITFGPNSVGALFAKINRTGGSITFTGTLSASVGWTCELITFRPAAISLKAKVGGSIFSGAYPGELTPQNNWQAHLRWEAVTGRPANVIKRYTQEDDTAASATNDLEGIVGTWAANGMRCVITMKLPRAVGGGTSAGITMLKNSIIWWRNNGIDADINVGNEVQIFGASGPFGNGSQQNWQKACPYNTTDINVAKQNYWDYWDYYVPTIISAGYPAMYCPSMVSQTAAVDWLPPRLSSDGHPYLCGVSLDYYAASDWIGDKQITLDDIIAACDAMVPPCPVGISEMGGSNGKTWDPVHDDPVGTLAGPGRNLVGWLDNQLTAKLSPRPQQLLRNLHFIWYANGTKNSLDYGDDARIISAWQRFYDALNG